MMNRCLSCNCILSDTEKAIEYDWGEPVELCLDCLGDADLFTHNEGGEEE